MVVKRRYMSMEGPMEEVGRPISSSMALAIIKAIEGLIDLPKGLTSFELALDHGQPVLRTRAYAPKPPKDRKITRPAKLGLDLGVQMTAVQVMEMRRVFMSIDMEKARKFALGLGWHCGTMSDLAESQATQRHMMEAAAKRVPMPIEAISPEVVTVVVDRNGWPSFARPGAGPGAGPVACGDCRQTDTCKRINTCVAHNCAFGEASPP